MARSDWLNVAAPITIEQLRGKVVILDFWTYGCVNCMHVLRDLKTLEQRFPDELVVIGVHSPKFTNEKSTENLKRILVRYEIEHPVANDANLEIWRRYGAKAWPTRVIIDPGRQPRRHRDGRGQPRRIPQRDPHRGARLRRTRRDQSIAAAAAARAAAVTPIGRCSIPARSSPTKRSGRLFIADSNHNRIVVATLDGKLIETIGSGLQGDNDGIFLQARFYRPQGLALDRRSALRRRHREPPDSRRRFPGARRSHRGRHRQAGRVGR